MKSSNLFLVLIFLLIAQFAMSATADANNNIWTFSDDFVSDCTVVNGCGSQSAGFDFVPDTIIYADFGKGCDWHDKCYGTEGMPQSYCDLGMLSKNVDACGPVPGCVSAALLYFGAVAIFGGEPYAAGQREAAIAERGGEPTSKEHQKAIERCKPQPKPRVGMSMGEPHIETFDGHGYTIRSVGDFRLVGVNGGPDLIQVRYHPFNTFMSMTVGAAVDMGNSRVVVTTDPFSLEFLVTIDGEPFTGFLAELPAGIVSRMDLVSGMRSTVVIRRHDGLQVSVVDYGVYIDVSVHLPSSFAGKVTGLLGNADGLPENDPFSPGGMIKGDESWDDAEKRYIAEQRISAANSWFENNPKFDYHGADALSYPKMPMSIDQYPEEQVAEANQVCVDAGFEGSQLEFCMRDVLFTGSPAFAQRMRTSRDRANAITLASYSDGQHQTVAEAILARDRSRAFELINQGEELNKTVSLFKEPVVEQAGGYLDTLVSNSDDAEFVADMKSYLGGITTTSLEAAINQNDAELVKTLLAAGADPNQLTGWNHSLMGAMSVNNIAIAHLLLDAGADPNGGVSQSDDITLTPFQFAIMNQNAEFVQLLRSAGARMDWGPWRAMDVKDIVTDPEMRRMLEIE